MLLPHLMYRWSAKLPSSSQHLPLSGCPLRFDRPWPLPGYLKRHWREVRYRRLQNRFFGSKFDHFGWKKLIFAVSRPFQGQNEVFSVFETHFDGFQPTKASKNRFQTLKKAILHTSGHVSDKHCADSSSLESLFGHPLISRFFPLRSWNSTLPSAFHYILGAETGFAKVIRYS